MSTGLIITILVVGLVIWMIKKNMNKPDQQIKTGSRPAPINEPAVRKVADLRKDVPAAPVAPKEDKGNTFPIDE